MPHHDGATLIGSIGVTLLLIAFSRALGGISSSDFGGAALLWAIYLLPAIVAPAAAALFNALVFGERGRRDDDPWFRLTDDLLDALRGILRIERQIGGAGLERGDEYRDRVDGARQIARDNVACSDA